MRMVCSSALKGTRERYAQGARRHCLCAPAFALRVNVGWGIHVMLSQMERRVSGTLRDLGDDL